jgi:hypothetical protein
MLGDADIGALLSRREIHAISLAAVDLAPLNLQEHWFVSTPM